MAHFYAGIQGNRGMATRMGSKESGIRGHIRGWDVGIKVYGYVTPDGEDEFAVYLTPGSNGGRSSRCIGNFTQADLEENNGPKDRV